MELLRVLHVQILHSLLHVHVVHDLPLQYLHEHHALFVRQRSILCRLPLLRNECDVRVRGC